MLYSNAQSSDKKTLSDGSPISSLIDRERREISPRVFSDPEIYQLEMESLFSKTWNIVGHVTEIPNVGDFVTRTIGEDPVIIVRNREGAVECLLNMCTHRGAIVVREEAGNANVLRCIYHGWVFSLDGTLRGMPWKEQMYPPGTDFSRLSLTKARVEIYAGIIFANWDSDAPSLDEYLGEYKKYMDLIFDKLPGGMEVLGTPQRFIVDANWKTVSEQFGGDAYHAGQLHRDLGKLIPADPTNPADWHMYATKVSTDNGHSIICMDQKRIIQILTQCGDNLPPLNDRLEMLPPPGVPREMLGELKKHRTEAELEFMMSSPPGNGCIFPCGGVWNMYNPMAGGPPGPFLSFRTYLPAGPDKFEFCMWTLVAKGSSEEYRDLVRRSTSFVQGAGGFVEGDDGAAWPGQTTASRGHIARKTQSYKYWAMTGENTPDDWPESLKGHVHGGFSRDDPQWNWWLRYFDRLEGKV